MGGSTCRIVGIPGRHSRGSLSGIGLGFSDTEAGSGVTHVFVVTTGPCPLGGGAPTGGEEPGDSDKGAVLLRFLSLDRSVLLGCLLLFSTYVVRVCVQCVCVWVCMCACVCVCVCVCV